MDGARFANALSFLEVNPADLTWRAGVDVLSLGATKNGALAAEAVLIFDSNLARDFAYRRKRGGHLLSKMRFLSAQLDAYLEGDLWLKNASHANEMAQRLANGLAAIPGARILYPVEANEVFVDLPEGSISALNVAGFKVRRWLGEGRTVVRLVAAFNTQAAEVSSFIEAARPRA
jgi:threonine aldolase